MYKIVNVPTLKALEVLPPEKNYITGLLPGTLMWIQQSTDARITVFPPHSPPPPPPAIPSDPWERLFPGLWDQHGLIITQIERQ